MIEQLAPVTMLADFFIEGTPVPQGSKKGFSRPGSTFVQIVDDNKKVLEPWRKHVAAIARVNFRGVTVDGAVFVVADFFMPRGATVKRRFPAVTPDVDKLLRALLDGITVAEVWTDDSRVVTAHATKRYADGDQRPGVRVRIGEYDHQPEIEGATA